MKNEPIDITKVAKIFGKSVRVLRDYKRAGIILPAAKDGMKDLYDVDDSEWAASRLRELVLTQSVKDAAETIVKERKKNRKEQ